MHPAIQLDTRTCKGLPGPTEQTGHSTIWICPKRNCKNQERPKPLFPSPMYPLYPRLFRASMAVRRGTAPGTAAELSRCAFSVQT
jgi:hypothetical protein